MSKINLLKNFYVVFLTFNFFFNSLSQQMVKFETFEIKMSQGGWNIGFGSPQTLMNGTNSYSLQMGTAFAGFNSVIPVQSLKALENIGILKSKKVWKETLYINTALFELLKKY